MTRLCVGVPSDRQRNGNDFHKELCQDNRRYRSLTISTQGLNHCFHWPGVNFAGQSSTRTRERASMRKLTTFLLALALGAAGAMSVATSALADLVTYTMQATADGSIGEVNFTDASVLLMMNNDTANVFGGPDLFEILGTMTVSINGETPCDVYRSEDGSLFCPDHVPRCGRLCRFDDKVSIYLMPAVYFLRITT